MPSQHHHRHIHYSPPPIRWQSSILTSSSTAQHTDCSTKAVLDSYQLPLWPPCIGASTMRCTSGTAPFTLLSLLTVVTMAQIQQPRRDHIQQLHKRANAAYQGCYSSAASMTSVGTYMYQSSGYCSTQCSNKNSPSMALTNGNDCYCGDEIPADSDKVDDTKCNTACTGYGQTNCTC